MPRLWATRPRVIRQEGGGKNPPTNTNRGNVRQHPADSIQRDYDMKRQHPPTRSDHGHAEPPPAHTRTAPRSFAEALSNVKTKKEEQERLENEKLWLAVWNSHWCLVLSYFLGTVCFIMFFHLENLPDLPFPAGRNLADWDSSVVPYVWWTKGPVLIELMWGFTHIRKTFFIVLSAAKLTHGSTHKHLADRHEPRSRTRVLLGLFVIIYHIVFGMWTGWANNVFSGYYLTDMEFVAIGCTLYWIGEITVTAGTMYFIHKRTTENEKFRRFRLASDFFIWTGFAVVSWTLPALLMFFLRFVLLAYFLYFLQRPSCF